MQNSLFSKVQENQKKFCKLLIFVLLLTTVGSLAVLFCLDATPRQHKHLPLPEDEAINGLTYDGVVKR